MVAESTKDSYAADLRVKLENNAPGPQSLTFRAFLTGIDGIL